MPVVSQPVILLCLCASHIVSNVQAKKLEYLLDSVYEQTTEDFKLYLGISFETENLKKQIDAKLKNNKRTTIHTFLFSKRHAQFERYGAIMDTIRKKKYVVPEQEPNTYLAFSDDDDLWSPYRMMAFRAASEKLHIDKRHPKYMFALKHFVPAVEEQDFTHWSKLPQGADKFVDRLDPSGYCDVLCKFSLLTHWFEVASPGLLKLRLCDTVLVTWISQSATLRDERGQGTYLRITSSHPLYYYRQSPREERDSPHVEATPELPPAEENLKHSLVALLEARKKHHFAPMTDDDLIDEVIKWAPLPRALWLQVLEQIRKLPLWKNIFVDLLGQRE